MDNTDSHFTQCHLLKYFNQRLSLIYYNDPNNNPVALAIYNTGSDYIWFQLDRGINSIGDTITINWPSGKAVCGFIVTRSDTIIRDDYYDHQSLPHNQLVKIPGQKGFFKPKNISARFKSFARIDNKNATSLQLNNPMSKVNNEINSDGQWVFWLFILIVALIIILWLIISNQLNVLSY